MKIAALDSNIFLYALLRQPPHSEQALELFRAIERGEYTALFASTAYSEVLGLPADEASSIAHSFMGGLRNTQCVPIDAAVAKVAGKLRVRYPGLRPADAIHVAVAVEHKAALFITNDFQLAKIARGLVLTKTLAEL